MATTLSRALPRTLTSRLVVTAVTLVALVSLLLALATTLAMRQYLTDRLDTQLAGLIDRSGRDLPADAVPAPPPDDGGGGGRGRDDDDFGRGPRGLGTLVVNLTDATGGIVNENNTLSSITTDDLAQIRAAARTDEPTTVDLRRLGDYRVQLATAPSGDRVVYGLPTQEIERAADRLLQLSTLLALGGVTLAALLGTLLVRRQLRPLREVADTAHEVSLLPLAAGGQTISTRVPARLTDPTTEVGQVGSALNTLLDHVDSALDARHRSEQQVRQFVADASHELRTPLSTIHGYAELSRRTPDDAAALGHAMGKVETEAQRMSALVEDLLLLARLDQGRPLERAEVDLTKLLLELVSDAQVVAPDHRWRLDLPEDPITVLGDEHRLHQVMSNLVGNARRHTPEGTTVTVGAQRLADWVRITVHDDGPGIPAELVGRVFERFTRGDSSRARESGGAEGAGLGLSLVQAIAQAHGGRVEVTSESGSTTFTLLLPKAQVTPTGDVTDGRRA